MSKEEEDLSGCSSALSRGTAIKQQSVAKIEEPSHSMKIELVFWAHM